MKCIGNNKGFTFIEIIAVLIITGILATVVISKVGLFDKKAAKIVTTFDNGANTRKDAYYKLLDLENRSEEDKKYDE